MRIKQYFLMTDYSLWEVILNGDSLAPTRVIEGVVQPVAPTTSKQRLTRKNELKACGTLLMALLDKYQLKFNIHKDAKNLMEKIEKRFGGNKETKKVKSSSSARTSTQNIAFVSFSNTDNTNEPVSAVASVFAASAKILVFALPNNEADDLEEMDLKWKMAMLTEPTNYALMAFKSLSSSSSENEVVSCSKSCTKAYATLQSHYDKLKDDFRKSQFDVISYKTRLESVEARLLVYQQNENVFKEDIKLLKLEVQLRDNALVVLRQKFKKAEQERDDLKLKLEKFQTSSKNLSKLLASQTNDKTRLGYNTQVFTRSMFYYDELCTSGSDESLPPNPIYDTYQLGDGYHVVPPPYTGTFIPPKPYLVFHNASNVNETVHTAFTVDLSTTKPDKDLSHTHRPSIPIIEDWLSNSEVDYEAEILQNAPSFVQPIKQVKPPRPFVKLVKTSIPAANPKTTILKLKSHGHNRNRKACFVCKSLIHLINDCDSYKKKMAQTPARNHAQRGNHQQYDRMTLQNPKRHVAPTTVLTKSTLVLITFARPVIAVSPKPLVTRPRQAKTIVTKPHSPPRRHITHSLSPKAINFPPKVTVAKAPMGNPQHTLKDKGVIDSGCSRHMIGNMSYLSKFKAINEGYVTFGGNSKGGKISSKGKIRTGKLDFDDVYFVKELKFNLFSVSQMVLVTKPQNKIPYELLLGRTPSIGFMRPFGCLVTILNTLDSLDKFDRKVDEGFLVGYSVSSKAFGVFNSRTRIVQETLDINFLQNKPNVASSNPTWLLDIDTLTKTMNYQPVTVAINLTIVQNTDGDAAFEVEEPKFEGRKPESEVYVSLSTKLEDITYSDVEEDVGAKADFTNLETTITINNDDFHTCMFACFLLKEEPKRVHQALKDPSWIEAMQEELLQFKMQKVWVLVDLPNGKRAIGFEDLDYPEKVYKVVKALYGLHQAPRACQDKYVVEILRKFGLTDGKSASTPIDTKMPLLKDPNGEDVDVHTYRSMIVSLMYLTSSRPDIMFAVYACARFKVTPKVSHLHAVKRIFRYLKGKPHLDLWYPKDSPFNLVAYLDSDYAGESLDRKSTTRRCQFLGCRLISWQCKKQTVVATSSTKAEYVAAASCCVQVLWIQNQLLDYGYNFMHTIIYIDNSSTIFKTVNDVTRLQALVDRKKVIITEATIREAIHLDDAKSIVCLTTEEIFIELGRMGYEKPSTKLTFYKAFFLGQWKFLIHTILQCMSAKRTTWNEFSSSMASAVTCHSTGRNFNFSKAQVGDLSLHSTKYSSPALTQKVFTNIGRVGKGFFGIDIPLFEGMIVAQKGNDVVDEGAASVDVNAVPAAVEEPSIPSPIPPPPSQDVPSTSQVQPTLPPSLIAQPPSPQQQPQPSHDAEISIDLLHILMDTCTTLTRRVENLEQDKIPQALEITKGIIANIDADEDVTLKDDAKEVDVTLKDDAKEVADDKFNSNMAFQEKTREQMEEENSKGLKRMSESQAEKAAKKQKLDEEVPVVDYKIYAENNKLYYKIKRANGTHQLYLSFLSMLRNFDKEDLEVLWKLVRERFASSKPKNFSDDFLLTTLGAMFEKPDVQAQI
nr:uncharacterized mitochondrial protein AtMg00810-like [Tanacetum cinerariifolium]